MRLRNARSLRRFRFDVETFRGHQALLRRLVRPAIAIGSFDGVHRGHAELIGRAVDRARATGGESVVLTFEPHPAQVLAPAHAPRLLTTTERKLELFADLGVDVCILEPFSLALAALSPQAFVREVIADGLGAAHVVVGYNFTFGKDRAGNPETLAHLGSEHGFSVDVVAPVAAGGSTLSSTLARTLVSAGDVAAARAILGRDFDVDGTVVRGAGRGHDLGYPTANIDTGGELLPAHGIYATWMRLLDGDPAKDLICATSVGTNPTFAGGALSIEAFALDFSGDLYGRRVRLGFVDRLRGEQTFDSPQALSEQIRRDVEKVRAIMTTERPP